MVNPYNLLLIVTRFRVLNITFLGSKRFISIIPVRSHSITEGKQASLKQCQEEAQEHIEITHHFFINEKWLIVMNVTLYKHQRSFHQIESTSNHLANS